MPPRPETPSASPSASIFPSILQHIAPLVPAAAFCLLALCLLHAVFRKCQRRMHALLLRHRRQAAQRQQQQQQNSPLSPGSEPDHNAIAPWELQFGGSAASSPMFLLQHPDLLFPPSPLFAYPHSPFPPFLLIHPSDHPMPPKYEDALKLPPPPGSTPPQTLCIPSLASRARMSASEQSPPPCYEQLRVAEVAVQPSLEGNQAVINNTMPDQPMSRLFMRRRERPPTYSASAEDLTSSAPEYGVSSGASDGHASAPLGLLLSDRPCSSCSLVDDPRAVVERRLRTFVAKSARKREEAAEGAEGGGTAMPWSCQQPVDP